MSDKKKSDVDKFYEDMLLALEDKADAAVQARLKEACPKMSKKEAALLWRAAVEKYGRSEGRAIIDGAVKGNMFDKYGDLRPGVA